MLCMPNDNATANVHWFSLYNVLILDIIWDFEGLLNIPEVYVHIILEYVKKGKSAIFCWRYPSLTSCFAPRRWCKDLFKIASCPELMERKIQEGW